MQQSLESTQSAVGQGDGGARIGHVRVGGQDAVEVGEDQIHVPVEQDQLVVQMRLATLGL